MKVELWQALAALGPLLLAAAVALPKVLTVRATNRQTDAKTLATAYGGVIDRQGEEIGRQGVELAALREHVTELLKLINGRDEEILVLRRELAAEREEKAVMRQRVETLEAKVGGRRGLLSASGEPSA